MGGTWTPPDDYTSSKAKTLRPSLFIHSISSSGMVNIRFSEELVKPEELNEIDSSVLRLSILQTHANYRQQRLLDNQSSVGPAFTWSTVHFESRDMAL